MPTTDSTEFTDYAARARVNTRIGLSAASQRLALSRAACLPVTTLGHIMVSIHADFLPGLNDARPRTTSTRQDRSMAERCRLASCAISTLARRRSRARRCDRVGAGNRKKTRGRGRSIDLGAGVSRGVVNPRFYAVGWEVNAKYTIRAEVSNR